MADSAVVVTSGTGTNIDTRTEATNGHHRQVVVLGDPATNAGVASVDATAGLKVDLGADNDVTVAGVSTAAKQDTIIGHVDGIEADTTTIAGDTTSIDAKIPALGQALAAASTPVVLTAAQITTLTPPAAITGFGTSANQTTIIGHLDGVEGLLTTIDSDTGTIATEVAGLLTDTELRATPVPVSGTVAVTNAGITTIAGAVAGTEMQVDVLTMPTTAVTGTFWQATQPVSLTSTTVTGTVAVTQSGTWDEVGINDSGNSITVDYATTGSGTSTGALRVELPTNGTGTVGLNAGTNAIGKLAANSGVDIGDVDVASIAAGDNNIGNVDIVSGTVTTVTTLTGGGIAHDSADSGNPHKIGYIAYSPDGTTPGTAVAELDRTNAKGNLDGQLFVQTEHPRWGSYHVDGSSALTDASVVADPGDGFQVVITNISFSSGAATAINMFLEEGSTKIFGPIYLEAVAGRGFCTPAGFRKHVTASTAVTITTSAAIAHSVDIQYEIVAV